ncbi:hypothetical protein E2C01_087701 [Portunus trituberculatus]|uniref:Uncharacterized protein n=1 Tax=Portunus trituberculatus TaxID=210409 RepID=A0A5B7JK27_PORTR|nr:hypothetical protein [Portunus trituberculatus]
MGLTEEPVGLEEGDIQKQGRDGGMGEGKRCLPYSGLKPQTMHPLRRNPKECGLHWPTVDRELTVRSVAGDGDVSFVVDI